MGGEISQLLGLVAQKGKTLNSGGIYCWDLYPKNSGSKSPQNTRYFRNHRARDSEILDGAGLFSRFTIYPSPFYFFFSSYHTTIQSFSLIFLHFFLLFVSNLAQSILRLQIPGKIFFLFLLFVFLSYAYPSISHSFSLKIWVLCRLYCFSFPTNFFHPLYSDLSQSLFVQCSQPYSDFPGKSNLIV